MNVDCLSKLAEATNIEMSIEERRIVLTGNVGNGKSASGNTILGRKVFNSRASNQSVTGKCQFETEYLGNKKYLIVDTPASFSSALTDEGSLREMAKVAGITSPGFHALIVVVKIGRFTEQERRAIEQLARLFGLQVYDKTIILFTGLDNLEEDGMQFDDYIRNHISAELKRIVQRCGNRVVGFNNRGDDRVRERQVQRLLECIESIVDFRPQSPFYNAVIYQTAEAMIDSIENERTKQQPIGKAKSHDDLRYEIRMAIQKEESCIESLLGALRQDFQQEMSTSVQSQHSKLQMDRDENYHEYWSRLPWYKRCAIL